MSNYRTAKNLASIIFFMSALGSTVMYAESASYYIHAQNGNDDADGRSEATAWKTLGRVSKMTFGPGDRLLFRAGGRWAGQLMLKGSGTKENPIHVGRYGEGEAPHIAGEGKAGSAVVLQNGSRWVIEDLEVTNTIPDGKRRNRMRGVSVEANSGGVFEDIVLRRLHVHHVSGAWDRQGGSGIWVGAEGDAEDGSTRKSRYDGVLIEDCYVHDVSFYGIMVSGWANRFRDKRWYPSTNVVVRNNFTRDTGGDSIVVICCDGPLIENNEGHRSAIGQSKGGKTHAAGMWPHSSDGTVMRYNRVVGIDAKKDGQAFDVDINCRNTLIEHNWSERNVSGFLLVCSPSREVPGTSGIIVRNNVSIDDGAGYALLKLVSDVRDVKIENNLFLNRHTEPLNLTRTWRPRNNRGWKMDVLFANNVFSTPGAFVYEPAAFVVPTFRNNTCGGEFQGLPKDASDIQVEHPAARIDNGKVVPARKQSPFKPFDISKAGLLPTSSWIMQRDASLEKSGVLPPPRLPTAASATGNAAGTGVEKKSKPNIVIIYADDMGYGDLGCYGCKDIPTPNIDQLAAEGVRFTDGYVSAPQCAPSRVGLLSGKYQNRLGFEYNPNHKLIFSHGFPRNEKTVGDLMKAQGYTTGIIGKWHMGAGPDLHPNKRGFDEFFGTLHGSSTFVPPFNMKSKKLEGPNKPKSYIQHNGKEVDEKEYLTDAFSREAVAFIDKYHDKPFFLYLPYTAPHGPLQATDKYLKRFPDIDHPKRRIYAAMVSSLDDGVGRIMAKLKERKLEEKTLVFFISDNGGTRKSSYGDNGPLRLWKGSLHEGGIRVPFIMTWKGTLPAGAVDSRPVIQLDATATAVDLAGGDVSDMNGVNLMPYLLKQKDGVPHKQLFWRIMSWRYPTTGEPYQKATRRGDWKLVLTGKEWELFNLKTDISEKTNLAAQHPELVNELKTSWNEWEDTVQFPRFPADSAIFPWEKLKAEAERRSSKEMKTPREE